MVVEEEADTVVAAVVEVAAVVAEVSYIPRFPSKHNLSSHKTVDVDKCLLQVGKIQDLTVHL